MADDAVEVDDRAWKVRATLECFRATVRPATRDSRKEVIQPQVPLRLPCYDFAPVTELTLDGCPLAVGPPVSGPSSFHGVTGGVRSEEHTSELQSLTNLVCRLLLEKKNKYGYTSTTFIPSTS